MNCISCFRHCNTRVFSVF